MGLTQKLGTIPLAIQTDSSNNVGIGGAANASYKLAVTGTGLFSSALTIGSTESTWNLASSNKLQINNSVLVGLSTTGTFLTQNLTFNSGWKYISTGTASIYSQDSGDHVFFTSISGTGAAAATLNERLRITNTGILGIGSTISNWDNLLKPIEIGNPGNFYVGFNGGSAIYMGTAAYYSGGWKYAITGSAANLIDVGNGAFSFQNAPSGTAGNALTWTERMRITSGGQSQMKSSTAYTSTLQVTNSHPSVPAGVDIGFPSAAPNNTTQAFLYCYDSSVSCYTIWSNGTTSGRSDIRYKKNVEDATPKLDKLMQLRVVNYEWKESLNGEKEIGLIAQEVEEVFPNLVITEPIKKKKEVEQEDGTIIEEEYIDGDFKSIKHSVLPFMILKALQEANAKIEELSAKVTALENK